jgi:cbb3-type cytochrome oxidase subunit 3
MHDAYFWIAFFGAPLFLVLVTAYVFRPCARAQYREAKQAIFADERATQRLRAADRR